MSEIVSIRIGSLWRESRFFSGEGDNERGEFVTMRDGSEWFHPYNGRAPRCVKPAKEEAEE